MFVTRKVIAEILSIFIFTFIGTAEGMRHQVLVSCCRFVRRRNHEAHSDYCNVSLVDSLRAVRANPAASAQPRSRTPTAPPLCRRPETEAEAKPSPFLTQNPRPPRLLKNPRSDQIKSELQSFAIPAAVPGGKHPMRG